MEKSRANGYRHSVGLTLIEVLIALAVIGIALTAVIKAASQTIRATTYLQKKMIATWAGLQVINEVRAGVLVLPHGSDQLHGTTEMLGQQWFWWLLQEDTPNKHIDKITVNVSTKKEEEVSPIVSLESYSVSEK